MTKYLLEGFEPQRVLRHFEDLCAIPHGSGHEEALADHIAALAARRGLETIRDAKGNIIDIKKGKNYTQEEIKELVKFMHEHTKMENPK